MGIEPRANPIAGFTYTKKATKTAIKIGNGCGKKGINDKARIMLTIVRKNAMFLRPFPSFASSSFSF